MAETLGDRLSTLLVQAKAEGRSRASIAAAAGVSPAYLNGLSNGSIRNPSPEKIAKLAEVLGSSAQYLVYGQEKPQEEVENLFQFRASVNRRTTELRDTIMRQVEQLLKRDRQSMISLGRRMPIVGSIAAGVPLLAEQNIRGFVEFDEKTHYLLDVRGDSMVDAGIYDGDQVHVVKTDDYRAGDVIVARIKSTNEVTVKFYALGPIPGTVTLTPANSARGLKPKQYREDEIEIDGKVIGVYRDIRPLRPPRQLRAAERKGHYTAS